MAFVRIKKNLLSLDYGWPDGESLVIFFNGIVEDYIFCEKVK